MYEILIDTTTAQQQRIKRKRRFLYPACCVCVDGIITLRLRSGYLRLGGPMKELLLVYIQRI
jgi:hypothetical protein